MPDIIACHRGRFIALELKVDSPIDLLQEYTIKKIKCAGGLSYIVTPDNWGEIFQYLFQGEEK